MTTLLNPSRQSGLLTIVIPSRTRGSRWRLPGPDFHRLTDESLRSVARPKEVSGSLVCAAMCGSDALFDSLNAAITLKSGLVLVPGTVATLRVWWSTGVTQSPARTRPAPTARSVTTTIEGEPLGTACPIRKIIAGSLRALTIHEIGRFTKTFTSGPRRGHQFQNIGALAERCHLMSFDSF